MALSRAARPREVGGLLLGSRSLIDDFVLMPGEFNEGNIYVRLHDIPIYPNALGTFHSHPGAACAAPSRADLEFFRRLGKVHLILAEPFSLNSFNAFSSLGKKTTVDVDG